MKKRYVLTPFIVAVLGLGFLIQPARGANDVQQAAVDFRVNDLFSLTLDRAALSFGALDVNQESTPQNIAFQVRSNHGIRWVITLQAPPLTHSDGVTIIPAQNFQYWHTFDNPDGNEIPAVGNTAPVPTASQIVFEAGPNIYSTNWSEFGMGFKVIANGTQKVGDYSTTLTFNLSDSF